MFSKWIIFIILFAIVENSPTGTPLRERDLTSKLNTMFKILQISEWNSWFVAIRKRIDDFCGGKNNCSNVWFQNGIHFENITFTFHPSPFLKVRLTFNETIRIAFEMVSISLKGHLMNTNHYIETEPIPLNFTLHVPILQSNKDLAKNIAINYQNLDHHNIKLLTNGYQYKPNEENEIKQDLTTYLRSVGNENADRTFLVRVNFMLQLLNLPVLGAKTIENEEMNYYFVRYIPSADYTLNNVTIKGLWNFRTILLDFSNPQAFPKIQISDVTGTMVQSFPSDVEKPLKLSFKADTLYASTNRTSVRIDIKAEGYSVRNVESNTLLTNDQSKSIVEKIISAIADQVTASLEDFKF